MGGGRLWLGIGMRGRRGRRWSNDWLLSWLRLLYDNPVWPKTDRLEEVRKWGLLMHAKWWRGPEGCESKVIKRLFRDGDLLPHI